MTDDFRPLINASEAWPALEEAILEAREEFIGGFRIFDLTTPLVSAAAKAIGHDWFDLLEDALRRGVKIDLTVADFDPVMATDLHKISWGTVRQGIALAEISGAPREQLNIRASVHPARAGMIPRLAFGAAVAKRRNDAIKAHREVEIDRAAVKLNSSGLPLLHPVTHHQKLAVIDGEILYIGGLDLNWRRWDCKNHELPARLTWSDVQVMIRGPEAQIARDHLLGFSAQCAGETPPSTEDVKPFLRTLSTPRRVQAPFLSPRTVLSEIEDAHIAAFQRAKHMIHIETQFLRSTPIAKGLAAAAKANPDLGLIMIMPALPEEIAFSSEVSIDARFGLAKRRDALTRVRDAFGDRLLLATPVQQRMAARDARSVVSGSPVIHVHNKVLVVDDDYAIVGSANLNGRSMRWDTEAAIELTDPERVSRLRQALMGHWWNDPLPDEACAPETMRDWWAKHIACNGVRRPESREGFLVPLDPELGMDLAANVPGATENIV